MELLMKTLSTKSVVRFAVVSAVCAFAPSMASAASWGVVNTTHTLISPNFKFTVTVGTSGLGWSCASSQFDADVRSASLLTITRASFNSCNGTDVLGVGCTVTATGTDFPWNVTAPTTSDVQIEGLAVTFRLESKPSGPPVCLAGGITANTSGTLSGGVWNAQREVVYTNGSGLVSNAGTDATVTSTIRDSAQTLTLSD